MRATSFGSHVGRLGHAGGGLGWRATVRRAVVQNRPRACAPWRYRSANGFSPVRADWAAPIRAPLSARFPWRHRRVSAGRRPLWRRSSPRPQ